VELTGIKEKERIMIYRGRVQNGVVVLEDNVNLPDGTEVRVEPIRQRPRKTLAERYHSIIGIVDDLPEDMAENHDQYLHGASKNR
jgi:hypothetical protein